MTLHCFSPPVMLATVIIEVALLLYTVWRYRLTAFTRLVVVTLAALATFQLSEYYVCADDGGTSTWARVGFVAITLLPPLGLHLLHIIANKPGRKLVGLAYAMMAGFIAYFILAGTAFTGHECTGNYVIFQIGMNPARFYALYYYGWLATAIVLGFRWIQRLASTNRTKAIRMLLVGYAVFIVPTAMTNTINPETIRGIPSIMCGFAVLFALILAGYLLPAAGERRRP